MSHATINSPAGVSAGSQALRVDARPILLRDPSNAWERTEQIRGEIYRLVENECSRRGLDALILESGPYVHPAWVKFECWIPSSDPSLTARAAMTVTISTRAYHHYEAVYKVEWERHGRSGIVDQIYRFGQAEIASMLTQLLAPPLGLNAVWRVGSVLRSVQLRQAWWQLWKPANKVTAVRPDWLPLVSLLTLGLGVALMVLPGPVPDDPQILGSGGTLINGLQVRGTLDAIDFTLDGGQFYESWYYGANAGDHVAVRMRSEDFDTFLRVEWIGPSGEISSIASNDDAPGDGWNSMVEFIAPETGAYEVIASSYRAGDFGGYTLEAELVR